MTDVRITVGFIDRAYESLNGINCPPTLKRRTTGFKRRAATESAAGSVRIPKLRGTMKFKGVTLQFTFAVRRSRGCAEPRHEKL